MIIYIYLEFHFFFVFQRNFVIDFGLRSMDVTYFYYCVHISGNSITLSFDIFLDAFACFLPTSLPFTFFFSLPRSRHMPQQQHGPESHLSFGLFVRHYLCAKHFRIHFHSSNFRAIFFL